MAGVIELMGKSLYSNAATPIRELIQNAHDSIRRRRSLDLSFQGEIRVRQDPEAGTLSFEDDGVGLTESEAERYLGTVGVSLTGQVKRGEGGPAGLIGQFGIGLLSSFLIGESIQVDSCAGEGAEAVRWTAGQGNEIHIGPSDRESRGTRVTLTLRPECRAYAEDSEALATLLQEFADFLEVPIFLGHGAQRVNRCDAAWLEPSSEEAEVQADLEQRFGEAGLAICRVHTERPVSIRGALYVSQERLPGFTSEATVHVTLNRMLLSKSLRGLLPRWAGFFRGVLELSSCTPTASREDLVRNEAFKSTKEELEKLLFAWLEKLTRDHPAEWQAILRWHRYTLLGHALDVPRLRRYVGDTLEWPTTRGKLLFEDLWKSTSVDLLSLGAEEPTVWFNSDRRQEAWIDTLFSETDAICVHATRSFDMATLHALTADRIERDKPGRLKAAKLSTPGFAESVLGAREFEELDPEWSDFLGLGNLNVFRGALRTDRPCLAFIDESQEVRRTFQDLVSAGTLPSGYQKIIQEQLDAQPEVRNEILLNTSHSLVKRALERSITHPLASVLRIQVYAALESAGVRLDEEAAAKRKYDLDWVSEALP